MNPGLRDRLEKRGYIGAILGGAAKLMAKPFTMGAKALAGGGANLGTKGLGVLRKGATEHPGAFLLNTAGAAATLPAMSMGFKDPNTVAQGMKGNRMAANTAVGNPMKTSLASSVLSTEDLEAALRVYQRFEKTAAPSQRFLDLINQLSTAGHHTGEGGAQILKAFREEAAHPFVMAKHRLDQANAPYAQAKLKAEVAKLHGEAGNIKRQMTSVEGREASRAKQMEDIHPKELLKRDKELEVQELQRKKLLREEQGAEGLTTREKARETREQERHEHERHRWSPASLAKAGLIIGGVATGVGAAVHGGTQLLGKGMDKVRESGRPARYAAVLKVDPALKDQPLAQRYFELLDRASPYVASEPYLAAAAVQQMVSTPALRDGGVPAVGPRQIQEFLNLESARQETKHPFLPKQREDLRAVSNLPLAGG